MIDEERADRSLEYLKSTDVEYGRAKALMEFKGHERKVVRSQLATQYMEEGMPASKANPKAECSDSYRRALQDLSNATTDFETIKAKRKRAELTIEMWRSCHSAMKRGNI